MFFLSYVVFFLLCYFAIVVLAMILFLKEQTKIYRMILIYFTLFFFSAFSDYINVISSEKSSSSLYFLFPLLNISIYILTIIYSFLLCKQHIPASHFWKHFSLLALTTGLIVLPFFIGDKWPVSILIAYLADNIFFIYLGYLTRKKLQTQNLILQQFLLQNKNFGLTLILGGFVTIIWDLYHFLYLPNEYHYFSSVHGNNVNNDGVALLMCFWLLKFFMQTIRIESINSLSADLIAKFCSEVHLTNREKDILVELLNNLSYQEIADKLHISIGTVKAHTHNIFSKTEVSRKEDLIKRYQSFMRKI